MTGRRREPVLISLEGGGWSEKHPYAHNSEEFAFVLEGEPTLTLGPEEHLLAPGDAVTIRAQELRRRENRAARSSASSSCPLADPAGLLSRPAVHQFKTLAPSMLEGYSATR